MKKIKIIVDEDGNVKRDFEGFSGDSCFKEADEIDKEMNDAGLAIASKKIKKKTAMEMQKEVVYER